MKHSGSVPSYIVAGLLAMNAITLLFGQTKKSAGENGVAESRTAHQSVIGQEVLTAKGLIGKPVEGRAGNKIATVNDLLLNTQSGRVVFVVLASGGFAGVGVKLRAVPPGALSPATAKRGILALDVNPGHWKNAPIMNKEQLGRLENESAARAIYGFYHQPWIDPTGRIAPGQSAHHAGYLKPATELIGERVINRHDGEVGSVADLAVALNDSTTARVIVEPTGEGSSFDVPMNQLGSDASGNNLFLNEDVRQLQTHSSGARSRQYGCVHGPDLFQLCGKHRRGSLESHLQFEPQLLTSLCKK